MKEKNFNLKNTKVLMVAALFVLTALSALSQRLTVLSPDQKIKIDLLSQQNTDTGEWYLRVSYLNDGKASEVIPRIDSGLSRSDQDFSKELKFLKRVNPNRGGFVGPLTPIR